MIDYTIQKSSVTYRPDIDGLRALAILLVIIFHGFPRFLKGGFIGVDIFFVISGYLISTIIFKALEQQRFSVFDFYSRRIRRIFPALCVVLSVCLVLGWYVLLADEYQMLGKHITAGAFYVSNFVLQSEAGYFDTAAEFKPLLHLWSLAIEEQFYLCFPIILMVIFRFKKNPIPIILLGLSISFIMNISLIDKKPSAVFFYPQTRAWELLIGSWIAYINLYTRYKFNVVIESLIFLKLKHYNFNLSNVLAWFGLGLIITGWIVLDNTEIAFPNAWALLPTCGAACIILAEEKAWFNRCILSNKTVVWFGLISYPLYLWHWPLLVFVRIIEVDKPKPIWRLSILIMSVLLAWLTHFFIEKPMRFYKHWLVTVGLLLTLTVIGCLGYFITQNTGFPNRFNYKNNWLSGSIGNGIWEVKWVKQKQCLNTFGKEFDFCLIRQHDKPVTVALIGDSHANHLYPGLLGHHQFKKDNILNLGEGSCPALFDVQKSHCYPINKALNLVFATPSIQTVILSYADILNINQITDNETEDNRNNIVQNKLRLTLQRLLQAKKQVIFVNDIPKLAFNVSACQWRPWRIGKQQALEPCAVAFDEVNNQRQSYRVAINSVLNEFSQVKVWDTTAAFCDTQYCWAVQQQKMLYRDSEHLNEEGSLYLGNYFNVHY